MVSLGKGDVKLVIIGKEIIFPEISHETSLGKGAGKEPWEGLDQAEQWKSE